MAPLLAGIVLLVSPAVCAPRGPAAGLGVARAPQAAATTPACRARRRGGRPPRGRGRQRRTSPLTGRVHVNRAVRKARPRSSRRWATERSAGESLQIDSIARGPRVRRRERGNRAVRLRNGRAEARRPRCAPSSATALGGDGLCLERDTVFYINGRRRRLAAAAISPGITVNKKLSRMSIGSWRCLEAR